MISYKLISAASVAALAIAAVVSTASAQTTYNVQTGLPTNLTLPVTAAAVVTSTTVRPVTTVTRAASTASTNNNANLGNFGQLILLDALFNDRAGYGGILSPSYGSSASDLGRLYVYSQMFNGTNGGVFNSTNPNNTINRLYLWNNLFDTGGGYGANSNLGRLFYMNELFRNGKTLNQNDLGQLFVLSDLFNRSQTVVPVPVPINSGQGSGSSGYICPSGMICSMPNQQQVPASPTPSTGTSSQGGF